MTPREPSKLDRWLVPDWRSAWRWLSVQLAAVAGLAMAWIFASPLELLQILYLIPSDIRVGLSPVVWVVVVAIVVGARLWKQRAGKAP